MKVHLSILQSFDWQGLDQIFIGGIHVQLPLLSIHPDENHLSVQLLFHVIGLIPQLKTTFAVKPALVGSTSQCR